MELSLIFECPQCQKSCSRELTDLAPGQARRCPVCGADIELTEDGLRQLRRDLEDLCRP